MATAKPRTGPFFDELDVLLRDHYGGKVEALACALRVDQATVFRWSSRTSSPQLANIRAVHELHERHVVADPRRHAAAVAGAIATLEEGEEPC